MIDRWGNSSKFWNTMPMRERSLERLVVFAVSDRNTVDGDIAFLKRLQSVDGFDQRDFPDPDGPHTTTTSPLATWWCSRSAPGSCRTIC